MPKTLENSLFVLNKSGFDQLRKDVSSFNSNYNGHNVIQDDIFHIIANYSAQEEWPFELLRYPIQDDELCACTFLRNGRVFVLINAHIPLNKQIFAAAHELYHLLRFFEGKNHDLANNGSILTSTVIDQEAAAQEDLEANAFAALLLAPADFLNEQMRIYGIEASNITVSNILMLMDIFAIPYKAMVLRLFEEGYISKQRAYELLEIPFAEILEQIKVTGKSRRWQNIPSDCNSYGSLLENLDVNVKNESLTVSRQHGDQKRIREIMELLEQG